jgi:hypothetical protein
MFPEQKNRKQWLQETNSFPGGKEAESVIKNISDIFIDKTFLMRTCLANSFMIGNFSAIRFLISEFCSASRDEASNFMTLRGSSRKLIIRFGQDSGNIMFRSEDVLPL